MILESLKVFVIWDVVSYSSVDASPEANFALDITYWSCSCFGTVITQEPFRKLTVKIKISIAHSMHMP
jgi:hypothetical protein